LELPSGIKKIFSYYSYVFLGRVALRWSKRFTTNKAGYWRSFGSKSMVRGVARNPVDHPHGGRTKSIKYPRTPWGKTTKFK
jgi:large subunit ribosomal protein L2